MANQDYWTPQLESKLHCWHRTQHIPTLQKTAPCVTISRDFGCQGYPFAKALLAKLNAGGKDTPWIIVGNQVLDEIARHSGYTVAQIKKAEEIPAAVKSIFSMFLDQHLAEETEIFLHMHQVIRAFAKRGHCIFIGRGAVLATQDLTNCLHVRLVAPHAFRVQKIMESHNLSSTDAENFIDRHQQQRKEYLKRFSDSDISDPELYHLTLNNSRLPIDSMVKLTMGHITEIKVS